MAAAEEALVETMVAETANPTEVSAEVAAPADPLVDAGKPVAEENPKRPAKEKKPRASKALKLKKPHAAKPASPAHPPYFQMIKEAILAVKEKGGLSPYAIAKHMEEKYKSVLPASFRKTLQLQLKNCVAKGRLVKVKGSFKLSETGKKNTSVKKLATAGKEKKPKVPAAAPKPAKDKDKANTEKNKSKAPAASKPAAKAVKSPKVGVKKARKAATAKPKQPKSIKSSAAKMARKATAV